MCTARTIELPASSGSSVKGGAVPNGTDQNPPVTAYGPPVRMPPGPTSPMVPVTANAELVAFVQEFQLVECASGHERIGAAQIQQRIAAADRGGSGHLLRRRLDSNEARGQTVLVDRDRR